MWRNSQSLYSKLVFSRNPNPNPTFLTSSSISSLDAIVRPFSIASDGTRTVGSTINTTSLSARDAVDLARHYGRCYCELSKARLSMLVVATSGTGFVLGSGNIIDFGGLFWTCAGTMMVAASANSLNQVFEINNDAKMKRTMRRPLPSGRLSIPHAVTWASSVGVAGTAILACKANMLAAGLAASNLLLYAFVYTPLKQIHPVNTWVGAVVGAIPPLLGWAAAAGQVSLNGMILPAALYFWQIPHFMALAYLCRDDYAAGGEFTEPFLSAGGVTSGWFCLESSLLTLAISAAAFAFYRDRTKQKARRMFHASLLYLPVFMSGLIVHRVTDNEQGLVQDNSEKTVELSSSSGTLEQENENVRSQNKARWPAAGSPAKSPVAYASVAPFPFLPAPIYSAD
ncbi:hypothetical protein AAG906_039031 [Vitis piasezkii]